jgi:hypothetical protein
MKPVTASVRIRRPRAAVHALLADLWRHEEYLDHFLVDWTITSERPSGLGATGRVRARGGGSDADIAFEIVGQTAGAITIDSRSGRRRGRRMRIVYALEEVAESTTQVTFALELVEGSLVDRATWALPRSHLERQYAQGMLRLKSLLEAEPAAP